MPRLTIFRKILVTALLLSLVPLALSSLFLFFSLETINDTLSREVSVTADRQASESLKMRARHVAGSISDFLRRCENDALFLARTRLDREELMAFYTTRQGEVLEKGGGSDASEGVRRFIPVYRSIALIDATGKELVVVRDGRYLPEKELRNVADPLRTEFRSEDYFRRTGQLRHGEVYVSHLTGFHVSKQAQLAGADEPEHARGGAVYEGVVRFCTPVTSEQGAFRGIIVLSLDHRHLMEFSQHIDPGRGYSTLFPSYKSGNYAFLFDDEGWIITHPKFWDIRGVDSAGKLVPPYRVTSTKQEVDTGRIPFNLDHAGFIHPNYPQVAAAVRQRQDGYVDITNVGGAKKIMAFAPILYSSGDYARHGIFGGVTIGFQVDQFHDAAREGSRLIGTQLGEHRTRSAIILMVTALAAGVAAWLLSRGISTPLGDLTHGARQLAGGDSASRVRITSRDEIGDLAMTFNVMADELQNQKQNLLATLDELRRSRLEIMDERNFKESILESISSAIITFSPEGELTSINSTGRAILGSRIAAGMFYRDVFNGWPGICERIEHALHEQSEYGRKPYSRREEERVTHYDVGCFPIGREGEKGLTVTLRNETEREKLREEMMRLDRLASLGKLSAGIAHEVRNPLTGISLLLDDLHDRGTASPGDQEMIKKAVMEIERVEKLISSLLNYASPARADFRQADLSMVINDTVLLTKRQAQKQQVTISWSPVELPLFRFDPEKIKQALLNIVKNAIEAQEHGGGIAISTAFDAVAETVTIRIDDNGSGIAEEDMPQVFEPFFSRKGAGTGLGLSITQRIVEEHHGTIWVNSSTSGTTFTIVLPCLLLPPEKD